MPRLFIAIELPGDVREELVSQRVPIPGARWVPPSQLHLTLAFLGDVEEQQLKQLVGMLERLQASPFRISFDRIGCFPGPGKPRLLWVGVAPEPRLSSLAGRLRQVLGECAIPQEERPFSPHITLARLKQPASRECAGFLGRPLRLEHPTFWVEEFSLFQSRLTPDGAIHTVLRSFRLTGGDGGSP